MMAGLNCELCAASWEGSQLEVFDCFNNRQSILFLQPPAWISAQAEGTW